MNIALLKLDNDAKFTTLPGKKLQILTMRQQECLSNSVAMPTGSLIPHLDLPNVTSFGRKHNHFHTIINVDVTTGIKKTKTIKQITDRIIVFIITINSVSKSIVMAVL